MKTSKRLTKKNPKNGSKKKTLVSRIAEKHRRRVEQRRAERQEATITWAKHNRVHSLPIVIDVACVLTAVVAQFDGRAALYVGGIATLIVGAGAGFLLDARREHALVFTHLAVGMTWAAAAGMVGIGDAWIWPTGLIIALGAQVSWLDQRSATKHAADKAAPVTRTLADLWNHPDNGILHRAGVDDARMYAHSIVRNNDGTPIGDDYDVDLSRSSTGQDAFCGMGQVLAEKMPGRVRRGAVNVFPDRDNVNHVTVRAIWVTPWRPVAEDPKGVVTHPIVDYLPELQKIVLNAIRRREESTTEPVPIPSYLKPWMPQMRSYVDPVPVGQREDRSTFWTQNYKKKFGVMHLYTVAESGGGKTSFINSELASEMPCRDVLFWIIDVSTKQGQDFAGWGSCIDWIATDAEEAVKMLKAAHRIAEARGREYKGKAGSIRSPKQAPTIKLIVDELSALYDELDTEVYNLINPLNRQGRTQGIQVQLYDQSGEQVGNKYGLKDMLRQMHRRAALKVDSTGSLSSALRMSGSVPYDMTTAPEGVVAFEDHQAPAPVVWRSFYVDTGDPDEGTFGVIPAIASLYAPFRPVLDEVGAQAAGEAYANRAMTREDNPLLTPAEVIMSHAPVNPVLTEDDLDENYANIRTGADWLDALLRGELHMATPDTAGMDVDDDDSDVSSVVAAIRGDDTPHDGVEYTPTMLLKKQGVPVDDGPRARQERRKILNARHQENAKQLADMTAEIDKIAGNVDPTVGLDVLEVDEPPQNYPDSDKIMAAAVELLRTQASKGTTTKDIAAKAGVSKRDTVMPRMRWLLYTERVVHRGHGRAARWYHPESAPTDGDQ